MISESNQKLRTILINTAIIIIVLAISSNGSKEYSITTSEESELPKEEIDLRTKFLKDKHKNYVEKKKIVFLDKKMPKSFYYDGILHFKVDLKNKMGRVNAIETAFRKMIAMLKVKYIYKRGYLWRTWREVKYPNGKEEIMCYHCHSRFNVTCPTCHLGGYWLLDDALPPCPYEIFSVVNKTKICVANTKQLKNYINPCPDTVSFDDLTQTCNNPIETEYRISRMYGRNNRARRSLDTNDICAGREACQILTSYVIEPDLVIFRIINKTSNEINYSRVMKNDNSVFACTDECGTRDPITMKILKNDRSLVVNLLEDKDKSQPSLPKKTKQPKLLKKIPLNKKNKRENKNITKNKKKVKNDKLCSMKKQRNNKTDLVGDIRYNEIFKGYDDEVPVTKTPCCKNVSNKYYDEYENASPEVPDYHYDLDE